MRIIKKPSIPKLECPRCRCVFKPGRRDLIVWSKNVKEPHSVTTVCPVCHKTLEVFSKKTPWGV